MPAVFDPDSLPEVIGSDPNWSWGIGSGSSPMSSGRLAMNRTGGTTPNAKANIPNVNHAVRQSEPVIMN